MSKKKKISKEKRIQRRYLEAQKAKERAFGVAEDTIISQGDIGLQSGKSQKANTGTLTPIVARSDKRDDVHQLPIAQIKKDLLKIFLYVTFAVLFLMFLKQGNIDLNAVRNFFKV